MEAKLTAEFIAEIGKQNPLIVAGLLKDDPIDGARKMGQIAREHAQMRELLVSVLNRLENMTTMQFQRGEDKPIRKEIRALLASIGKE